MHLLRLNYVQNVSVHHSHTLIEHIPQPTTRSYRCKLSHPQHHTALLGVVCFINTFNFHLATILLFCLCLLSVILMVCIDPLITTCTAVKYDLICR